MLYDFNNFYHCPFPVYAYICGMYDTEYCSARRTYTVVRDMPARRFIGRYRLPDGAGAGCVGCPRYGRSWVCPPFGPGVGPDLGCYKRMLVVACVAASADDAQRGVDALYVRMLGLERRLGGLAFGVPGGCRQCGRAECSRTSGAPCVHPELARISLEALGFDLCALSEEVFGLPLKWDDDSYVVMITGVMY